jgi:hypothetical protein
MIKLKHKYGLFGTPEVNKTSPFDEYSLYIDEDEMPYHLEFIKIPFSLVAVDLNGKKENITNGYTINMVNSTIDEGTWVEFDE